LKIILSWNGVLLKNKLQKNKYESKEKGVEYDAFFIIAYFLSLGLAFVAPVDFFAPGAAFLAVAFVAILLRCISPSHGVELSPQKTYLNLLPDETPLLLSLSPC
jgi:hypothetical protein